MMNAPAEAGEIVMASLLPLLALIVSIANIVWTWIAKGQSATSDRVKAIELEITALKLRTLTLEGDYKHLPSKDDISGLKVQLESVLGKISKTESELVSVNGMVRRIDDFLRDKA